MMETKRLKSRHSEQPLGEEQPIWQRKARGLTKVSSSVATFLRGGKLTSWARRRGQEGVPRGRIGSTMMRFSQMKTTKLLLALVALISQLGQGRLRAFADPPAQRAVTSAKPGTHVDHYGDPLPERAVCRLGTRRPLHYTSVINVAFSPDGRRFASTALDGTLVVWSWLSGKVLHVFPPTPRSNLMACNSLGTTDTSRGSMGKGS